MEKYWFMQNQNGYYVVHVKMCMLAYVKSLFDWNTQCDCSPGVLSSSIHGRETLSRSTRGRYWYDSPGGNLAEQGKQLGRTPVHGP